MKWEKITINYQNVRKITARAVLIACPHSSAYDGYSFWHPVKLVRAADWYYKIVFTNEFVFRLKKYGKGRFNQAEIIDAQEVGATEIKEMFANINEQEAIIKNPREVHKPPKLEPQKVEIAEELKDD